GLTRERADSRGRAQAGSGRQWAAGGAGARGGGACVAAAARSREARVPRGATGAGLRDGGGLLAGEARAGEEKAEVDVRGAAIDRVAIHVHVRPLGGLDVEAPGELD